MTRVDSESGVMFYSNNLANPVTGIRKKIHGGSGKAGTGDGYGPVSESILLVPSENVAYHKFVCDCAAAAFLEFHDVSVTRHRAMNRTNRRCLSAFDGFP